ncbi:MAG: amidohydrolase family protein [Myxococcota bacterium]
MTSSVSQLLVTDGRITGFDGSSTVPVRRIDFGGGTAVPAFELLELNLDRRLRGQTALRLNDAASRSDLVLKVQYAHRRLPPEAWIIGEGFDDESWPDGPPRAGDLEGVAPGRPVALEHVSEKRWWLSHEAKTRLAIEVPKPVVSGRAASEVRSRLPPPTGSSLLAGLLEVQRGLLAQGVVEAEASVASASVREGLFELERRGDLKIRFRLWLDGADIGPIPDATRGRFVSIDGLHLRWDPNLEELLLARAVTAFQKGHAIALHGAPVNRAAAWLRYVSESSGSAPRFRMVAAQDASAFLRVIADAGMELATNPELPPSASSSVPLASAVAAGIDVRYAGIPPLRGAHAAVNGGRPASDEQLRAPEEERLPVHQALGLAFTHEGATASSLGLGSKATFVVLDRDPLTVDPAQLGLMQVLATVVRGEVAFLRAGSPQAPLRFKSSSR